VPGGLHELYLMDENFRQPYHVEFFMKAAGIPNRAVVNSNSHRDSKALYQLLKARVSTLEVIQKLEFFDHPGVQFTAVEYAHGVESTIHYYDFTLRGEPIRIQVYRDGAHPKVYWIQRPTGEMRIIEGEQTREKLSSYLDNVLSRLGPALELGFAFDVSSLNLGTANPTFKASGVFDPHLKSKPLSDFNLERHSMNKKGIHRIDHTSKYDKATLVLSPGRPLLKVNTPLGNLLLYLNAGSALVDYRWWLPKKNGFPRHQTQPSATTEL